MIELSEVMEVGGGGAEVEKVGVYLRQKETTS